MWECSGTGPLPYNAMYSGVFSNDPLEPVYHWLMSRLATALCLTASVCLPQSPSTDPFLAWLDRIAQQQLDGRERAIAAIRTQADADRRKAMVRAKLTELIGGL